MTGFIAQCTACAWQPWWVSPTCQLQQHQKGLGWGNCTWNSV